MKSISYQSYLDKVYGCWMGKSIGGTIGAPVEGHKQLGDFTERDCWPKIIYPNDDLDIQIVWLEMMQERGLDFTQSDLIEFWKDRCWYNFCEYGYFLYNVQRGILPPASGKFNNDFFGESMGCPIRSEIWSVVSPGDPEQAARYARMDGELDHWGISVEAEQFWAAVGALAFCGGEIHALICQGLARLPTASKLHEIAADVQRLLKERNDWRQVWLLLMRKYGDRDNSKVAPNFAITLLALLAGGGDFRKTMCIAMNCGWDADCTAATAGALLGILNGFASLPKEWVDKMGLALNCDVAVQHKCAPMLELAQDCALLAIEATLLGKNEQMQITGIVPEIKEQARLALESRSAPPSVSVVFCYPEGYALYRDRPVRLEAELVSSKPQHVHICLNSETMKLSQTEFTLELPENQPTVVSWECAPSNAAAMYDKNLVLVSVSGLEKSNFTVGLAGARQWKVYGPYWDAYDWAKYGEVNPFRNEDTMCNPSQVEGCGDAGYFNYVQLERPYLDERALLQMDLPEELPFVLQKDTDLITSRDLGGYNGEASYYLVREIAAPEETECDLNIAANTDFTAFLDGKELFRQDTPKNWCCHGENCRVSLGNKPKRLVVKLARQFDEVKVSVCFRKTNIPGDKTVGDSYLIDKLCDSVS